jgi:hypothetical protein
MQVTTRREFGASLVGAPFLGTLLFAPASASACLYGKWRVKCANGHVDTVDDATCQHKCEKCRLQVFSGNKVTVVCRNGHANEILTGAANRKEITQHYICPTCKTDCRLG